MLHVINHIKQLDLIDRIIIDFVDFPITMVIIYDEPLDNI